MSRYLLLSLLAQSASSLRCNFTEDGDYSFYNFDSYLGPGVDMSLISEEGVFSKSNGKLNVISHNRMDKGTDKLGNYEGGMKWVWKADNGKEIMTEIKNYEQSFVVFTTTYFDGWTTGSVDPDGSKDIPLSTFPGVTLDGLMSSFNQTLSWTDMFMWPEFRHLNRSNFGRALTSFYSSTDILISTPLSHFKTVIEAAATHTGELAFIPGLAATYDNIPKGFSQSVLLYGNSTSEVIITEGYEFVGQLIKKFVNPQQQRLPDVSLTKLTYQTDNGGQYCYCSTNCSEKLLSVKKALDDQNITLGQMSYQGAWWNNPHFRQPGTAIWCVTDWETNTTKYPIETSKFQKMLDLPLQLYAPHFCPDTPYAKVNGGLFDMIPSNASYPGCTPFLNAKPSESEDFYNWFFDQYQTRYGMNGFEQDFMNLNYKCVPEFIKDVYAAEQWQAGMNAAAMKHNLPVQWCMASATDLLQSIELQSVTNFRASGDYRFGSSWDLGVTSILLHALGSKPSKDTFWTQQQEPQPGSCTVPASKKQVCPADHSPSGYLLNTILALLSTGPVGFSDAIGETAVKTILKTCDSAGNLLQPSRPIAHINRMMAADLSKRPKSGNILITHSDNVNGLSKFPVLGWYVLGHHITEGAEPFYVSDLYPRTEAPLAVAPLKADDDNLMCDDIGNCTSMVSSSFMELFSFKNSSDPFLPQYYLVVPGCSSWFLYGDLSVYAPLSRYTILECSLNLTYTVKGVPGEVIHTRAYAHNKKDFDVVDVIPAGGVKTTILSF
eukprot:TRINITY_DN37043_c0_g1_i1.p1 TRINITY_DN37043_c0_g1~~TRINITY_DN37043_c0_g1_i1.p1  ORF type:complete len:774 (+),score=131.92 TRINITY_DN37043_c0_g1_i1:61-2382(+)